MKHETIYRAIALALCLVGLSATRARADARGPNLFPAGSFSDATQTYNPWSGVDGDGNIHGLDGKQNAVGDDGNLYMGAFGPSVAVGDLNGDGKPDIVLADSRGFFWYFPNTGPTPQQPKFTQGQVIPIWLGENADQGVLEGIDNIVPRIQLVDFNNDGRLGIVAGTYAGKLFYIPNRGSSSQPDFPVVSDTSRYLINTHARGQLWCNYLAPCLYKWFGTQLLDLVMGEGTYSANSIYLLQNTNSNLNPGFTQAHEQKIIPGMGLEQLTPSVVDWNNDGKPDILSGDRTGYINLFTNTSTDLKNITFDLGKHVAVAGTEKFGGGFTTVTTGDLSGNKLPNLFIGTDAGTVLYAKNTGKLGAPVFTTAAVPIKGINPLPKITVPTKWVHSQPQGVPDELVVCTNPQLEKGFVFPTGETTPYALKFFVYPIQDPTFKVRYYPANEDFWHEHTITCSDPTQPLTPGKRYNVHVWIKAESTIQGLYLRCTAGYFTGAPKYYTQNIPLGTDTSWSEQNIPVRFEPPETKAALPFGIEIRFTGQGALYMDDLSISEAP